MGFIKNTFPSIKAPVGAVEFLIVGLGNPGEKYSATRHNVGFCAVDLIAEKTGARVDRLKFKSLCGDAMLGGKRVLLMKPQTFMNNSGEAVAEAMRFYKIPVENIIVISDDISLNPGKLRIREKGSAGGHNGLKNIIYLIGKDTFPRIKIGVGAKPHKDYDLADWVLGVPSADSKAKIAATFPIIQENLSLMLSETEGDFEKAVQNCNGFRA